MEAAQSGTATGAIGGQLGTGATRERTFHGGDPHTVAADTICKESPTTCQVRTRVYRDGRLIKQGFPVAQISDHLADTGTTIWLDLRDPDHDDSRHARRQQAQERRRQTGQGEVRRGERQHPRGIAEQRTHCVTFQPCPL